jgi:hypothetical protein
MAPYECLLTRHRSVFSGTAASTRDWPHRRSSDIASKALVTGNWSGAIPSTGTCPLMPHFRPLTGLGQMLGCMSLAASGLPEGLSGGDASAYRYSVLCWNLLSVIDNHNGKHDPLRFQLEAELILKCAENGRPHRPISV